MEVRLPGVRDGRQFPEAAFVLGAMVTIDLALTSTLDLYVVLPSLKRIGIGSTVNGNRPAVINGGLH
jgi:hypothetical protein